MRSPGGRRAWQTGVLSICLVGAACSPPAMAASRSEQAAPQPALEPDVAARHVVEFTNLARRDAGHRALTLDPKLMRAAQLHAEQMAARREMAHVLPGARYPELTDRLKAVDYTWRAIAENIAVGAPSAEDVVAGWIRSPSHRENLFNDTYTAMGAGYAMGGDGRPYWVQVFARPQPPPP